MPRLRRGPAPYDAAFAVVVADRDLPAHRKLAAGSGISLTDGGPGSTLTIAATGGSGTVTSVAQTVPTEFSVSGSPVTTSGTLAISKATQSANTIWAGPTSGGAAQPTFRTMVAADLVGHKTSHQSGGSDAIKLDDLSAPDDNTDLNASTSAHGLLKKLSNNAAEFMNGVGAWATPADAYPGLMLGVTFVYTDAHTITLDPSVNNPSATALLTLWNGSALKLFTVSATKTCDLAASGAGGLDTGAEAASTGYYVWGIGKSDGTFALLFSVSATSPTLPSGYTYYRLLYFVRNGCSASTTDICKFWCTDDGRGSYYAADSTSGDPGTVLNGGTATSPTAIDLTSYVPTGAGKVIGLARATINSSVTTTLQFYTSSSGAVGMCVMNVSTAAAQTSYLAQQFEIPMISALTTSLYYSWSAASTGRDALYRIQGWRW